VHTLNSKTDQLILEVRVAKGYGARWALAEGEFRGLVEPQVADGHAKKWLH